MDLWHPEAVQVRAPESSWGIYDDDGDPFRGVIHTTETDTYSPSTKSYYGRNVWPHATILPDRIVQHIPINRAARALRNTEVPGSTNNEHAVQCEVVWRASKAASMPDDLLAQLAKWMRYVERTVGVKPIFATFYGEGCGWTLASESARQRFTPAAWRAFNGWCGHQHVPENSHWDPGALPVAKLLPNTTTPETPIGGDDMPDLMPERFYRVSVDAANSKAAPGDQTIWITKDEVTTHAVSEAAWVHGKNLGWYDESRVEFIPKAIHDWMVSNTPPGQG